MGRAGLMCNALYLVRPDGYVGLCDPNARPETLTRYLGLRGLRLEATKPEPPKRKRRAAPRRTSPDLPS
jgi:hypothetical protein